MQLKRGGRRREGLSFQAETARKARMNEEPGSDVRKGPLGKTVDQDRGISNASM
jgi:hypothetical protein